MIRVRVSGALHTPSVWEVVPSGEEEALVASVARALGDAVLAMVGDGVLRVETLFMDSWFGAIAFRLSIPMRVSGKGLVARFGVSHDEEWGLEVATDFEADVAELVKRIRRSLLAIDRVLDEAEKRVLSRVRGLGARSALRRTYFLEVTGMRLGDPDRVVREAERLGLEPEVRNDQRGATEIEVGGGTLVLYPGTGLATAVARGSREKVEGFSSALAMLIRKLTE